MSSSFTFFHHEDTKGPKATQHILYRTVFLFVVILRAFVIVAAADDPPIAKELKANYEHRLQDIASHVDGVVGYDVLDLTTGDRIAHLEDAVFPTASTIKLAIVYELFKQVEEGTVRLDQTIVLDRAKAVGGSGVLHELGTPTLSVRDYATLMVILSDNTATNVLIDLLGMENVTRRMAGLGLKDTKLRRKMIDIGAARRGDENVSTPREIVDLLAKMSRPADAGRAGADMIALLEKTKSSRLRKGLPAGVETADKPGELEGVRVDAGIVYAKNRPYILCVMTTYLKSEAEGERAIEEMSRASYEYFSRLGAGLQYGRQVGK
jgi:beta-lactamase class A